MDLRKERTLKLLDQAFTQLVHEKPFEQITVSELCDAAMIRRATFYRHFSSLDDYLAFFVRSRRQEVSESVMHELGDDFLLTDYCQAMTHALVKLAKEHSDILRSLGLSPARDRLFAALGRELAADFSQELLSRGCFSDADAPERERFVKSLASFYVAGLFGLLGNLLDEGAAEGDGMPQCFDRVISCIEFPGVQ